MYYFLFHSFCRYLLERVAEDFGVVISLDPKPIIGEAAARNPDLQIVQYSLSFFNFF